MHSGWKIPTLPSLKEAQLFSSEGYKRVVSAKSRSSHVFHLLASLWASLIQRYTVVSLVMCAGEWSSLLPSQQKSTSCTYAAHVIVDLMWLNEKPLIYFSQGRYLMILHEKNQSLFLFLPTKSLFSIQDLLESSWKRSIWGFLLSTLL